MGNICPKKIEKSLTKNNNENSTTKIKPIQDIPPKSSARDPINKKVLEDKPKILKNAKKFHKVSKNSQYRSKQEIQFPEENVQITNHHQVSPYRFKSLQEIDITKPRESSNRNLIINTNPTRSFSSRMIITNEIHAKENNNAPGKSNPPNLLKIDCSKRSSESNPYKHYNNFDQQNLNTRFGV